MNESAFMLYWRAINQTLNRHRLPELRFSDARALWLESVHEAAQLAQRIAYDHPAEALAEVRLSVSEAQLVPSG